MEHSPRWRDWMRQAENDLLFLESALREGFYAQCCFIAQQASEKALKAVLYAKGAKAVFTHSLIKLCEELDIDGALRQAAGALDQYYISARYPDALPGGAPLDVFSEQQASQAIQHARDLIEVARIELAP